MKFLFSSDSSWLLSLPFWLLFETSTLLFSCCSIDRQYLKALLVVQTLVIAIVNWNNHSTLIFMISWFQRTNDVLATLRLAGRFASRMIVRVFFSQRSKKIFSGCLSLFLFIWLCFSFQQSFYLFLFVDRREKGRRGKSSFSLFDTVSSFAGFLSLLVSDVSVLAERETIVHDNEQQEKTRRRKKGKRFSFSSRWLVNILQHVIIDRIHKKT